jgi:endonuclease/exonuclease/phosphatase (EEP) superfamily protein YafD
MSKNVPENNRRRRRTPARRRSEHPVACWLVVVGLVVAIGLALALRFGTDRMWWLEIVRYAPSPFYLLPAVLLVGVAWRLNWFWRLAAMAVPALIATEIMGLAVGNADDGTGQFRFMTYNVKSYLAVQREDGFARLGWEIATHDPDVIVLQDAQIIASLPVVPAAIRKALAGRQTYVEGQYLVASRFPLKGCAPVDMSYDGYESDYVHCTLTVHGTDIDLFTAHFVSPREGLNAARGKASGGLEEWELNFANRLTQADMLTRGIVHANHPVIVAGDLNADERSPVVRRLLATGLRDAFSSAGVGYGYTHGHSLRPGFSFLRIDHVLVGGAIGVKNAFVGGRDGSEHRPVIADLLVGAR